VYEVASDVRFGHELANHEFWVTKLPRASVFVTVMATVSLLMWPISCFGHSVTAIVSS
jgi:hypothetical protein